ncbi:hypothetical protein PA598K_04755 [Paenibacillus sp. 598K]|uniref:DUF4242 domain-containing protein n=1 Tax=Paenibacillus sp. 598K TaxID=1117987 RepID=UPI000FF9AFBF|nr:DUF4242 domain-containing protein [Paenibacillus sp. 598K]GBF76296.1 hypothetical protein PA598K_04755 [Paenibacillus sp. 598K]
MALYLAESELEGGREDRGQLEQRLEVIAGEAKSRDLRVVEVQIAADHSKAYLIFEAQTKTEVEAALLAASTPATLVKEVRLLGQAAEEAVETNYLVEWNLPTDLTMEQYLERKRQNSVHYAEVPEVSFSRTYVCEDMSKCLCFYQAPDEAAVKRAREAVSAPIDAITPIASHSRVRAGDGEGL